MFQFGDYYVRRDFLISASVLVTAFLCGIAAYLSGNFIVTGLNGDTEITVFGISFTLLALCSSLSLAAIAYRIPGHYDHRRLLISVAIIIAACIVVFAVRLGPIEVSKPSIFGAIVFLVCALLSIALLSLSRDCW